MRTLLSIAAVVGLLITAGAAYALEVTGIVSEIKEGSTGPVVTINGNDYAAQATAIDDLKDIEVGDTVSGDYTDGGGTNWLSDIRKTD